MVPAPRSVWVVQAQAPAPAPEEGEPIDGESEDEGGERESRQMARGDFIAALRESRGMHSSAGNPRTGWTTKTNDFCSRHFVTGAKE